MKIWIERALAGLRWGWEKFVALAKVVWTKLSAALNTVIDPPPAAIKVYIFVMIGIAFVGGCTFAYTRSYFYSPTTFSFLWMGDDSDVVLPEMTLPLPSVPTPASVLPEPAVVCHDMSDTPHCEAVAVELEPVVVTVLPPVAKKAVIYKKRKAQITRRKHKPIQTYWGF